MTQAPRLINPRGQVELLTKPTDLCRRFDWQAFGVTSLPQLQDVPKGQQWVAVFDADALAKGLPRNKAATELARAAGYAGPPLRGVVAILPDGHFGGFYA